MTTATAQVFRLPDLGEGLTEAGLVQWLVRVGDTIAVDQAIAEVETAKSTVELPSPFAGVVTALHGEPGDALAVGAPVLEVADAAVAEVARDAGSEGAEATEGDTSDAEKEAYRAEERAGGSGNVLIGYGTSERADTGRRRPARAAAGASRAAESPSAPDAAERTTSPREQTVPSTASGAVGGSDRVAVRSPLVRRLARDLGVDVRTLTGTGDDGAITRADVLAAAVGETTSGTQGGAADQMDGLAIAAREKLLPMRRAISAKLSRSRSEIPEATVWVDVDATDLWNSRARMASPEGSIPSLTALIARFTLIALAEHPVLASRLTDDELLTFDGVNLGVAVDTDRGLIVPVIPRAHERNLHDLDAQLRELTASARAGTMSPERLRGSTFTLNNYGGLGVDGSAAIINHPEVAILGVGRMIERPWVVGGEIVARRIVQLSLVFDHRVCDGGYAAAFLRRLVGLIENPLSAFGRI